MQSPGNGFEKLARVLGPGRVRLLSYRTVGLSDGLLLALRPDRVEINGRKHPGMLVAASAHPVSDGENIRAWLGRKRSEGLYESADVWSQTAVGALWVISPPHVMIHRRVGHPASAPGAGDGAGRAGANGGRGPGARALLIEHNLRLVVYIARRFENTGINIEDLISIGTIGLIKAINTFRLDKNIKLATYASPVH